VSRVPQETVLKEPAYVGERFVEQMGFKPGVKERRVMDGESEDTENDEVMCAM